MFKNLSTMLRKRLVVISLAALLAVVGSSNVALAAHDPFNDEYVYATTRGVSDMDAHPALKLTLMPLTLVIDTAFLPFAVIAGFVA
jgi:uncharacterized protein YceK